MMSGLRVFTTLARIESDSWLTASAMFSRRRLRATLTTGSPDSSRTRKPLSALRDLDDRVQQRVEQLGSS